MLNSEAMVAHFPAVPVVCYPQIHRLIGDAVESHS